MRRRKSQQRRDKHLVIESENEVRDQNPVNTRYENLGTLLTCILQSQPP